MLFCDVLCFDVNLFWVFFFFFLAQERSFSTHHSNYQQLSHFPLIDFLLKPLGETTSLKWPFANWTWLGKCFLSKSIDLSWMEIFKCSLLQYIKPIWPFYTGKLWRAVMNLGDRVKLGKGSLDFWTAHLSSIIHQRICLHSCQAAISPKAGQLNRCRQIPWEKASFALWKSVSKVWQMSQSSNSGVK